MIQWTYCPLNPSLEQPGRDVAGRGPGQTASPAPEAGAFTIVLEGTLEPVARAITEALPIPTIGIGASPACDGQVLVSDDMLGLFNDFKPRFVKHFADLAGVISKAAEDYATEVRARTFPGPEHTFQVRPKT